MAKKGKARLEEMQRQFRHKMPEDERCTYQKLLRKRKIQMWLDFLESDEDFGYNWLLGVMQFKINRMIDYWRQSSHLANGDYIRRQMELASRLLQIVQKKGNENGDYDNFPYRVNLRNKERFKVCYCSGTEYHGEKQRVRFCKAYCLFFKLMQENLLHWWD